MDEKMMQQAAEAAEVITKAFTEAIQEYVPDEETQQRVLAAASIKLLEAVMNKMREEVLGQTAGPKTGGKVTSIEDYLKNFPPNGN